MLCWILLLRRVSSWDLEATFHRKVFRRWNVSICEYVNMILGPIKCCQDKCFLQVSSVIVGSVGGGPRQWGGV